MSVPRPRILVIGAVVLVVVVGVVAWFVVRDDDEAGRLATAVAMAPGDAARLGWTDWSRVREELDRDLSETSPTTDVEDFLTAGFDADLTSVSALVASAPFLHERYGFSPATIDWELFSQSEEGAIVLMGLPESLDIDQIEDALEELGYVEPDEPDGVWEGGHALLTQLGTLTQELAFITIDRERRVLASSDEIETVETWRDVERGDDVEDGLTGVLDSVEGALSAAVYTGEHACAALAMTEADDTDRVRAAELLEQAGEVNPLRGFAIAGLPGGDVRVAMSFESEDQARTNADTRRQLAAGPAPGQGGSFPERFELGDVVAEGEVVTMELHPRRATYVLSDLANGPVLFATC
ncbi:hypothetical protein [Nocardioides antri]|uniref:DUF3352 domain-containing protein n=1 Tax=Nocardioides antri TaxID=2607659 RepID=A0A5B1M3P1_9ACTN|nr:hypothetical protein [Nocardioides antri]KAA1427513.1 hypothetical protein F0U47_08595 [Nocardioides antri]